MKQVPKIIHQIWDGDAPLPQSLKILSETWINKHPDWKYELWNDERIHVFVQKYYPEYWDMFNSFPFNVQRWDTIRYLILDKIGGVYIDFDSECFEPIDPLIKDKSCWIALEPWENARYIQQNYLLSNAIMGAVPGHFFFQKVITHIAGNFNKEKIVPLDRKGWEVVGTTGPFMLLDVYENLPENKKKDVHLIHPEYLSPLTRDEVHLFLSDTITASEEEFLQEKIKDAFTIHYFMNLWTKDSK